MVATRTSQPFRLLHFRNRSSLRLLSLFVRRLRTVLAVKGSLRRAENGAPLTAPGRSEQDLPNKRERRAGKPYDPGIFTAQSRTRYYASMHPHSGRGAGCRNFSRLPARERSFSLDILFYRTERLSVRVLVGEPDNFLTLEIFSGHIPRLRHVEHQYRAGSGWHVNFTVASTFTESLDRRRQPTKNVAGLRAASDNPVAARASSNRRWQ